MSSPSAEMQPSPVEYREPKKFVVVGDIHGDFSRLLRLLKRLNISNSKRGWSNPSGYHIVFLGDLNDPWLTKEKREMSSLEVLEIVHSLCVQGLATALHSNHQHNLLNWWNDKRSGFEWNEDKLNGMGGLSLTIEEIQDAMIAKSERIEGLMDWLDSLPYFHQIYLADGRKYICVHAFYDQSVVNDCALDDDPRWLNFIYGIRNEIGHRIHWWREPQYHVPGSTIICGHYHRAGFYPSESNPRVILLDGGCGGDHGTLLAVKLDSLEMLAVN